MTVIVQLPMTDISRTVLVAEISYKQIVMELYDELHCLELYVVIIIQIQQMIDFLLLVNVYDSCRRLIVKTFWDDQRFHELAVMMTIQQLCKILILLPVYVHEYNKHSEIVNE